MTEYYLAINGQQQGPFSKEQLRQQNISPDTLVWHSGMSEWKKGRELPELNDLFEEVVIIEDAPANGAYPPPPAEDAGWFAMLGQQRVGPATITDLINSGLNGRTPVWHEGYQDWIEAGKVIEISSRLNSGRPSYRQPQQPNYGQNPQYGPQPNYGQNPQYGPQPNFAQNPQYGPNPNYRQTGFGGFNYNNFMNRKDWLAPAIIATVVGFLFSCIGVVFGIIAIVKANKANQLYASGMDFEAERENSTAKTMTLIAFGLAAVGLIATILNFVFN